MWNLRFWRSGPSEGTTCDQVRRQASYLVDDEDAAPAGLVERLKRHINGCDACAAFVRTLQATVSMMHQLPPQSAPSGLRERLRSLSRESDK